MRHVPGAEELPSRWGADPAFWVDGREIVHCHGGEVELRVTRRHMSEALSHPRAVRRSRTSDWVQVPISETDLIMELAEIAASANANERGQADSTPVGGR